MNDLVERAPRWLRRLIIVAVAPVEVIACVVWGMWDGAREYGGDAVANVRQAWSKYA